VSTDTPFDGTPSTPPPPIEVSAHRGWAGSDLAIGSSLIVLLIALFLPWFSFPLGNPKSNSTGSIDGPQAHGYLWAVFALAIVALVVLVGRDTIDRVPGNLPSPGQVLTGATGLALLLTILGVVSRADVIAAGWSYGGFVTVLAALIAFLAALGIAGPLSARRQRLNSRPSWRLPRTGG
jgi:hypothetical protein